MPTEEEIAKIRTAELILAQKEEIEARTAFWGTLTSFLHQLKELVKKEIAKHD